MSTKIRLLITNPHNRLRGQLFDEENITYLNQIADVVWNPYEREFTADELKQLLPQKDAVITSWGTHPLTGDILDEAEQLQFVGHTGGTVKWLVEEGFFKRKIEIVNANAALAPAVAEYCLLMSLTASWNLIHTVAQIRKGDWLTNEDITDGLNGKTIGLIGYGVIAEEFIRLLKPFDVTVFVYSNHCGEVAAQNHGFTLGDLKTVCQCDIVSLHAALNDKTYHLLGKEALSYIKDGAVLINTGRAHLIEECALMEELCKKRFMAVLDVFHQEPLPKDHELRAMEHVICTPHSAGANRYWRRKQSDIVIEDMVRFFSGDKVRHGISLEQYRRLTPF